MQGPRVKSEPTIAEQQSRLEQRVLLVPPTQRDAEAIRSVFDSCGVTCETFESIPQMCKALGDGVGAVVVSEEALLADSAQLMGYLSSQPVWSDLPVIVLSRSGSESGTLAGLLDRTGNVAVVERPVRVSTFLSIVRAAFRGRARQYEVREHLKQIQAIERERTQLWESERAARSEVERASRIKDEFLATLSHEIRTPLNAILGWTHILGKGGRPPDEMERGLAVIERNAKAQAQIVADLLDMNRIMNGKVRLNMQRINVAEVIRAAIDTCTPAADAKGVKIQLDCDPSIGLVSGDPERLQQVFWNLLSNAVKFSSKGERVIVTTQHARSLLEISVIDTGDGIDAKFLPYVFDRFRQADGSTTRRHGGLGLGLAIVKQLVEMHGGSVRARSGGRDKGSTFIVTLPVAAHFGEPSVQMPAVSMLASREISARESRESISGVKVLVVDDDADARDLVRRLLEAGGAKVSIAASAAEAVEVLQRERPDVLVSDIGMPGEDGYSLMKRVRALTADAGGKTPAIALTAYARTEDRMNSLRAGFQYHVAKPLEPLELMVVVASAARRITES